MFYFAIENAKGERLSLTDNTHRYVIDKIDGLAPVAAKTNKTQQGSSGEKITSIKIPGRNINVRLVLQGDIEQNRVELYRYCKVGEWITVYYRNGLRDVMIKGMIEDITPDYFSKQCGVQIVILCPKPFFKAAQEMIVDISRVIDEFAFPFSIEEEGIPISSIDRYITQNVLNSGDRESGLIIEMEATGDVLNPRIYNTATAEMLGVNIQMQKGDKITFDTNEGEKTVYLLRDGVEQNIFNLLMPGVSWLPLKLGDNVFTYESEEGTENLTIRFRHHDLYGGV